MNGILPTLRAVMGDNLPAVAQENKVKLLLNDQGGGVIQVESGEVSPTLRRETKGHEPVILNDHGDSVPPPPMADA